MSALQILAASSELLPARSQMAFTLGFHIIIACLGVAFPAIMLIANYIGLKRDDEVALGLARRWSKVAAVTFAVGAVTGTVLSFEFGLLWPEFTGRFGEVFGILFAIEGIFFFLEAIFIAIYIFGWDRLSGWAHFWSGVPIAICGIGGAYSVVAVNAWMNQPQGFTLDSAGNVTDIDPLEVMWTPATGYEVAHMILAAYLVTAFLVASVYAVGMLRGRRDRHHRLGLLIPLTVASILAPIQAFVGDTAAREIAQDQPIKFAAMECVDHTHRDVTEYIGGICTDDGVEWGIGIPGLNSFLVGWNTDTEVIGLDSVPPDERPPANTLLHLSFDAMVGIGTAMIALGAWFGFVWWRRKDIPRTPWFLRIVAGSGVAAIIAMEAGWIVTEVGRQPWIVYEVMRTEEAITGASGVWITFSIVLVLYAALGTATVLILRRMARRWREDPDQAVAVPYGPSPDLRRRTDHEQGRRRRGDPLDRGDPLRRLRRRRLRRRLLVAGQRPRRARRARPAADRLGDRPGLGGEPRLADLHPRGPVDGVRDRVRGGDVHPVHPALPGGAGDRAARLGLRLPRGRQAPAGAQLRRAPVRGLLGNHPVLHGHGGRRDRLGRVPLGNAAGDPWTSWLNPVSILIGVLFVATGAYLAAVFLITDARHAGDEDLERYFSTRALGAALVTGAIAIAGIFVLRDDAQYVYDRLTAEALPLVIASAVFGIGALALIWRRARRGARPLAVGAVVAVIWGWGVAQFPYLLPESLTISAGGGDRRHADDGDHRLRRRGRAGASRDRPPLHAHPARPARDRARGARPERIGSPQGVSKDESRAP